MNEETTEENLSSTWFSTYGLVTAKRILERFNVHISDDELLSAIKNPSSTYYQLLRVPLKNVLNGIILQQAHDYQVYAQKLFIDYLLSAESSKDEESPGANTRADIEAERAKLIEIGEAFSKQEFAHRKLIGESQACLIKLSRELQVALEQSRVVIESNLSTYFEQTEDMAISLRSYRTQFYNLILRVTELLNLLNDYHVDPIQDALNRASLHFDVKIGGE